MSLSTESPESGVRCPQCSASVRAGTEWCSLCYADLRPPPPAPPAPEPVAAVEPDPATATADAGATEAATADGSTDDGPTADEAAAGGKHARRRSPAAPASPEEVARLADELVAELAARESGSPFGAASKLVDTSGKRAALMVGGAVGAMLLCFVVMAVLGALV